MSMKNLLLSGVAALGLGGAFAPAAMAGERDFHRDGYTVEVRHDGFDACDNDGRVIVRDRDDHYRDDRAYNRDDHRDFGRDVHREPVAHDRR